MKFLPTHTYKHHVDAVHTEARRGTWILWNQTYSWLWAALWVLGLTWVLSKSSSALYHWASSPAPFTLQSSQLSATGWETVGGSVTKNELEVKLLNPVPSFCDSPTPLHHPVRHTVSSAGLSRTSAQRAHHSSPIPSQELSASTGSGHERSACSSQQQPIECELRSWSQACGTHLRSQARRHSETLSQNDQKQTTKTPAKSTSPMCKRACTQMRTRISLLHVRHTGVPAQQVSTTQSKGTEQLPQTQNSWWYMPLAQHSIGRGRPQV